MRALLASLISSIVDFLKDNLEGNQAAGDPLPPGKLGAIATTISKLSQIQLTTDNNGLADWLDELDRVLGDTALRDTIIVRALQLRAPRLAEALTFAGLITAEFRNEDPRAFAFRLAWNRLDDFLSDPGNTTLTAVVERIQDIDDLKRARVLAAMLLFSPRELLKLEYAQQGFAALPNERDDGAIDLVQLVDDLISSPLNIAIPIAPPLDIATLKTQAAAGKAAGAEFLGILGPDALGAHQLEGFGVELKLNDVPAFASRSLDLGGGLRLVASSVDTGPAIYRLVFTNVGTIDQAQAPTGDFEAGLQWSPPGGVTVIGPSNGTRMEIGPARFTFRFQKPVPSPGPLFSVRAVIERVALIVSTGPLGFLATLTSLPSELRMQTDISVGYLQGVGIQAQGGGDGGVPLGLEFAVPLNLHAGSGDAGVSIERALMRVEAKLQGETLRARTIVRFGTRGQFGPVQVAVDGVGAWFGHWDGGEVAGLEPPTGMALSLDVGPVSGGGFLARLRDGQFAGGLEVKVIGIGVSAFGLFGQADGAPAFVAILGIGLPLPGVQIGFGFAITRVGGLVGINRRADTDVLREQLASGTTAQILFCEDVTKNALSVIGQLPRLFPPARGVIIVGPTFRISWLELFKLDVGLFIEMPGPRQIFMAGSARLVVGSEDFAVIYFRMDFVGGIDLVKSLIYFDAVLVNSHVMHVFTITGGIALRIAYGANGYFLFSVGGFHPSFNPGGLELPRVPRAGTNMSVGIAWFKLENYLALTSNTFQLGARIEAGLELGPISAHGWLYFDALIQYSPFYFTASIGAGFDVEVFGVSLCGIDISGTLSGPGPLVIHAEASLRILFVRVSGSVTLTLGEGEGNQVPAITNVLDRFKPEFRNPANLRCEGDDPSVILKPAPGSAGDVPILGVMGALIWEQKRAPFGLDLQRFEGVPLDRVHRVTITAADMTPEQDWFGVGTYLSLSQSEALNNARFIQAQSGVRVSLAVMDHSAPRPCDVNLDLIKLPKRSRLTGLLAVNYMSSGLTNMQGERATKAVAKPGEPRIKTTQERWNAHDATGAVAATDVNSIQAFTTARAGGGIAQPATASPVNLAGVF
jgi:hypothetical protein